jgi:hypothetical protein
LRSLPSLFQASSVSITISARMSSVWKSRNSRNGSVKWKIWIVKRHHGQALQPRASARGPRFRDQFCPSGGGKSRILPPHICCVRMNNFSQGVDAR